MDCSRVENLVFEGGGMKGISFCGVITYLEEVGILNRVKRVIGSSAGAVYATLIACKVDAKTCRDIVENSQFKEINQGSWNLFSHVYRFMYSFGWYRPDNLYKWYDDMLKRVTDNSHITFEDLYNKTNIELIVTGTNVSKKCTEYFCYKNNPKMEVGLALRISTCIPILWPPIVYEQSYYVDGGTLNNYPIWYFDTKEHEEPAFFKYDNGIFDDVRFKDMRSSTIMDREIKTIGFKLISSDETISNTGELEMKKNNISTMKEYVFSIIEAILIQLERADIHKDYWRRTIIIPTSTVSTINFSLTKDQVRWLIDSGYKACKERIMYN